ncbi:MAG: methyltransferase domain-containing protein, partial [bacterium]|nr:methyltransferase domain-containing protein [bacterium]
IEKDDIEGKYDLIILSNILEHLKAPLEIILKIKKNLKKNGHLLIAIPNIAFWQVRRDLLFGKFKYQKEGILNEEHLRFYTYKTFTNLLSEAKLKIIETQTNYQGWRAFIADFWPTMLASQFIILCQPPVFLKE